MTMTTDETRRRSYRVSAAQKPIPAPSRPITIGVRDARILSGLGASTIFTMIRQGKLETVKGGSRLFCFASLERLLTPEAA